MDDKELCCEQKHVHDELCEQVTVDMPNEDTLYDVAELFKIFGDSTRIRILSALTQAEMCVCDICKVCRIASTENIKTSKTCKKQTAGKRDFLQLRRRPCSKHNKPCNRPYTGINAPAVLQK